jgi:hypothetical protein
VYIGSVVQMCVCIYIYTHICFTWTTHFILLLKVQNIFMGKAALIFHQVNGQSVSSSCSILLWLQTWGEECLAHIQYIITNIIRWVFALSALFITAVSLSSVCQGAYMYITITFLNSWLHLYSSISAFWGVVLKLLKDVIKPSYSLGFLNHT